MKRVLERRCQQIGQKVFLVVNYDGTYVDPLMMDAYANMISYLSERYYSDSSRYSTSAFLRMKLGAALNKRKVAPHIFETREQANAELLQSEQE